MAHPEDVVAEWLEGGKGLAEKMLKAVSREDLLRVDSIQQLVDEWSAVFERAAFTKIFEHLTELGAQRFGECNMCGLRRERERKPVRLRTTRMDFTFDVWRYRCRACGNSVSPLRKWLGLESGQTTAGFDRALCALSIRMSFGETAKQMLEQHGHDVDRTLVERRTYAVSRDAEEYLAERGAKIVDEYVNRTPRDPSADRVLLQIDSGGVPVGKLVRPPLADAAEFTPVRGLPKGKRPAARREVRAIVAKQPGQVEMKVIDLHVAPHNQTEFTGERMFLAALEAGLGHSTHVHGTFDMAKWQTIQFDDQFGAQPRHTICADFYHTIEYIAAAADGVDKGGMGIPQWRAIQHARLMAGERDEILSELKKHDCSKNRCPTTDVGKCAVKAASRYLANNGQYMEYKAFRDEGLPIGSGEVEGLIRHAVRRRLDVPGAWREDNLSRFTALLTIYHSGWWSDFWRWRDARDQRQLAARIRGTAPSRFRGPQKPRPLAEGFEQADFEDFSPMFGAAMAVA